jgi:regulator of cell morphogenesis and NO signaling
MKQSMMALTMLLSPGKEEEAMDTQTITLAELAITRPGATRVFLANGLDFCCGGRRPLTEACTEKGLNPETILQAIAAADQDGGDLTRWANRSVAELTDFIVNHYHVRLRTEIPELILLADKVERVHAEKASCPHGLTGLLHTMHAAVLDHLEKEEQILFPMIRAGRGRAAGGPIHVMEQEHDDHGRSLARLRELTANLAPPPEACATWRALYLRLGRLADELMEHIHLENNVLFPRALFE